VQRTPAACICLKLIRNIVEGNATIIALIEKEVASIPKLVSESISESINATAA
jgi:Mg2+ and Co2+ transporter CorA